jgi:hypothetical protein
MGFIVMSQDQKPKQTAAEFIASHKELVSQIYTNRQASRFLDSLANQLSARPLSDKQLAVASRILSDFEKTKLEAQIEPETSREPIVDLQVAVGDILTVNKMVSLKIGLKANSMVKKFHNVEVLEIIDTSDWYLELRVSTCYKKTSHCGICGLLLTDERSIAQGIGPVCANGYKIKGVEELEKALGKHEMVLRLPRSSIKAVYKNEVKS